MNSVQQRIPVAQGDLVIRRTERTSGEAMILIEHAELELWGPDFASSGQSNPTWTRLRQASWVLANSLEAPEWLGNPVQVVMCDAYDCAGCSSGSYVHVSRTPSYVVWAAPQISEADSFEGTSTRLLSRFAKSALFSFHSRCDSLEITEAAAIIASFATWVE
jgi:hypothetical protein